MNKIILTLALVVSATSASAASNIAICTPTVPGYVNFISEHGGLSRITTIEVTQGKEALGGYGIIVKMDGTAGARNDKASVQAELAWYSFYGSDLFEYDNAATAKSTKASPYIRFEVEKSDANGNFLGALTVSSQKDPNGSYLLTSRYKCRAK